MTELKKQELNEDELEKVNGGDNGDYKLEWSQTSSGVKYLYNIEQYVEVYDTGFHIGTTNRKIVDRRPYYYKGGWVGEYQIELGRNLSGEMQYKWILADDIES